jgi:heparanase 1
VLFKQLVGTKVLGISDSTKTGRTLRVYAFCSRNITGGVVVVAININQQPASFTFQSGFSMYPRLEYHLTAPNSDVSSEQIELNGRVLEASADGALPSLEPITVDSNEPITLAALSYGFFVLPKTNAEGCSA